MLQCVIGTYSLTRLRHVLLPVQTAVGVRPCVPVSGHLSLGSGAAPPLWLL